MDGVFAEFGFHDVEEFGGVRGFEGDGCAVRVVGAVGAGGEPCDGAVGIDLVVVEVLDFADGGAGFFIGEAHADDSLAHGVP